MRNNIMHHQLQTLDSPSVITFSTERPRMIVPRSFIAQNAPTESCRCTTRIPWYHQNPAYTHRILFALTACIWMLEPPYPTHNSGQHANHSAIKNRLAPAEWYCTSLATASWSQWEGSQLSCSNLTMAYRYNFVCRRHENMSPYTDSSNLLLPVHGDTFSKCQLWVNCCRTEHGFEPMISESLRCLNTNGNVKSEEYFCLSFFVDNDKKSLDEVQWAISIQSYQYRNPHCKNKPFSQPSYLTIGSTIA